MSVPPTAIAYNVGSARTTAPTSMDEFFGRSNLREHEIPLTWDPIAGIVQADTADATKTVTGKAS